MSVAMSAMVKLRVRAKHHARTRENGTLSTMALGIVLSGLCTSSDMELIRPTAQLVCHVMVSLPSGLAGLERQDSRKLQGDSR